MRNYSIASFSLFLILSACTSSTTPPFGDGSVSKNDLIAQSDSNIIDQSKTDSDVVADSSTTVDAPPTAANNQTSPLGSNLGGIKDWSSEWAFVDAFKQSREWISSNTDGTWDDGREFDLDEHGWVKSLKTNQIAKTLLFWSLDGDYPSGQYIILYDGKGTITYSSAATKDENASSLGRDVINVDSSKGGIILSIEALDSADPIKNIRVIMPGGSCDDDPLSYCTDNNQCSGSCISFEQNYSTQIFHPHFLNTLKTYKVIRFMDWMETNNSEVSTWDDRPKIDDARWTTHGAPIDIMVALSNLLHADAWFTLPHKADDNYVQNFAQTVKNTLYQERKAYIEYSNEVWNSQFSQAQYSEQKGLDAGLSTNSYEARLRYYSQRSVEIFRIWHQVFSNESSRIIRVMASQAASVWVTDAELSFNSAASETDVLAIAPYFGIVPGPAEEGTYQAMSLDQLFIELENVTLPETVQMMQDQAAKAKEYNVELVTYEGGQHLVGFQGVENNDTINVLFDAANRDSRMKTLYDSYLKSWKDAGGHLFVHYLNCGKFSKWGRWGSLEYLEQPRSSAPKFDSLQSFISQNPIWW